LQHLAVDHSDCLHDPLSQLWSVTQHRGHIRAPYAMWFIMCGRNLITGLTSATSPRVDILSTCKVGQKLGVSLPLLTCSPSAWLSQLLYHRGRKSRRDLRITVYVYVCVCVCVLVCVCVCVCIGCIKYYVLYSCIRLFLHFIHHFCHNTDVGHVNKMHRYDNMF
jgi:hypothetical protein